MTADEQVDRMYRQLHQVMRSDNMTDQSQGSTVDNRDKLAARVEDAATKLDFQHAAEVGTHLIERLEAAADAYKSATIPADVDHWRGEGAKLLAALGAFLK